MKQEPFVIERTYNAPVEQVWNAITDKNAMKQWYFDIAEFKPEVGFEFSFEGRDKGKVFIHLCKITEVVVNKKLTYSWRYKDYEGNSFVTFELFDENGKTKLVLTHTGLHTFPASEPGFKKSNFVGGWTEFVTVRLKDFVEK